MCSKLKTLTDLHNFDEVVGKLSLVDSGVSVYFDHNEKISSHANFCFNGTDTQLPWIIGQLNDCSDLRLEKYNITFSKNFYSYLEFFSSDCTLWGEGSA